MCPFHTRVNAIYFFSYTYICLQLIFVYTLFIYFIQCSFFPLPPFWSPLLVSLTSGPHCHTELAPVFPHPDLGSRSSPAAAPSNSPLVPTSGRSGSISRPVFLPVPAAQAYGAGLGSRPHAPHVITPSGLRCSARKCTHAGHSMGADARAPGSGGVNPTPLATLATYCEPGHTTSTHPRFSYS